ncbi:hypothetical protein LTR94_026575, partial [Friedmanniomyces endolithicus]
PPDGRLCRRSGRVRACAILRCRPDSRPRWAERRRSAVPFRHPAHRMAGGRKRRDRAGDTVAVWGCGPVGLFAVQSAFL